MVIHVEVCKAHPFTIRHPAKVRVRLPLEVSRLAGKAIHEAHEFTQIVIKLNGRRSACPLV
jgi:hypothetical protein